jgi:hypothetical protein
MIYDHKLGQGGVGPSVRMCHRRQGPIDGRMSLPVLSLRVLLGRSQGKGDLRRQGGLRQKGRLNVHINVLFSSGR